MSRIGFKATTIENEVHNTLFVEEFLLNVDDRRFHKGFVGEAWNEGHKVPVICL
jgi:hypothetical protein